MIAREFFQEKGLNVSRETFDRLLLYHKTLLQWQKASNLISNATLSQIWERHFLDSAQLNFYISSSVQTITDFGSGAGFPGMVLALLTDIPTILVESNQKKAAFLREVQRVTKAPVTILSQRIETLPSLQTDLIVARAVSVLSKLIEDTAVHLKKDGVCLFLKGKNIDSEINTARHRWEFLEKKHPSITDCTGVILEIKKIRRKQDVKGTGE